MIEGYCLRCKKKVPIKDLEEVTIGNETTGQRNAVKGFCPECGTKICKMVKK